MVIEQVELRNQLQTLWHDLSLNPCNRALAVARVVAHHGDDETIRLFVGLIERQTPPSDEREQALKMLADPTPLPPPQPVSSVGILFKPPAPLGPESSLERYLEALWHELGGNPRNRALAMAQVVKHHGDEKLMHLFASRIGRETPRSEERQQALKLLVVPKPFSHIHIVDTPPEPQDPHLPVDPEMARLTIFLDCASELRLWVVARELSRLDEGSGVISKKTLKKQLLAYGIRYTPRHVNRLLERGEGLFWYAAENQNIYVRSWINLALELARRADARGMELEGNKPGVRQMLLDISGSLEHWEAAIYAGWISHRDGLTIARETLSQLFGREPNTIRRWEAERLKDDQISIRRNYVQCSDPDRYFYYLPDYTVAYLARMYWEGKLYTEVRLRWQMPNSYFSATFSTAHKGQASKVRKAINAEYPPYSKRGGQCSLRYVMSPKKLKRLCRSLKFRMGLLGDVYRPFYVFLGEHRRTRQGIFEITNSGFVFTDANERAPIKAEKEYFDALARRRERAYREQEMRQKEAKIETFISPT
jgi:hypothetical protein